jgi:8-oxo-dGTP pyrophosphatase MutT (NUDIX family)
MDRHITVSGFVVHEGRVALHWHRKNQMWLPAGGHIEANEDPLEAALREIKEEFGIDAEVIRTAPHIDYAGGPRQIEPPFTLLECPIAPDHVHIDCVYFCRAVKGYPGVSYDGDSPIVWLNAEELAAGSAPVGGEAVAFPADIVALGLEAIRLAALAPEAQLPGVR